MKKAPSTILAAAGITAGLLGFALPASASTAAHHPHGPQPAPFPVITTHTPGPINTTHAPGPFKTSHGPRPIKTTYKPGPINTTAKAPQLPPPPKKGHKPPSGQGHQPPPRKGHTPRPGQGHQPPFKHGHTSAPKPKQVCHRVPVTPKKTRSWEKPKTVYTVKCTPVKPTMVKKAPAPPKHHQAPKRPDFWGGIF
jgi:hypothetical protein